MLLELKKRAQNHSPLARVRALFLTLIIMTLFKLEKKDRSAYLQEIAGGNIPACLDQAIQTRKP
jgi:hypothetical protein